MFLLVEQQKPEIDMVSYFLTHVAHMLNTSYKTTTIHLFHAICWCTLHEVAYYLTENLVIVLLLKFSEFYMFSKFY